MVYRRTCSQITGCNSSVNSLNRYAPFWERSKDEYSVPCTTNRQTYRFNKTIIVRLQHYVAEHHRDCDIYAQWLTYSLYQVHRFTNFTPFSLVLYQHPPDSNTLDFLTALPTDARKTVSPLLHGVLKTGESICLFQRSFESSLKVI